MNITRCRSCRASIVFLLNARGGRTPTDVDTLGLTLEEIHELPDNAPFEFGVHVSHFKTCPDANSYSRGRK